ncbi:hypothetical protein ACM37_01345 [Helicobacter pylori]|nr:hypothetical protein ACM37_01345 [Helicobacter pylori]
MPIISSEKDSEIFFSKLSGTELYKIFYYKSKAPKTKKIFIVKNSLLDSGLDKSYLKDSRYPKNFSYAFYLFFTTNGNNELSIHKSLTPLILKAFESKHMNVKHKHREKELEILFFESKQELYNSINKP